MKAVGDLLAAT